MRLTNYIFNIVPGREQTTADNSDYIFDPLLKLYIDPELNFDRKI